MVSTRGTRPAALALKTSVEDANSAIAARDEDLVKLREQLSAAHTTVQHLKSNLTEARSKIDQLQHEAHLMLQEHATAIDKVTTRVVQAEQRYVELEKRTLVELDHDRMAVTKLQKSLENERRIALVKHEKLQLDPQTAQILAVRQEQALAGQRIEIDTVTKERDSAIAQAEACGEGAMDIAGQLAAERAHVEELRQQICLSSQRPISERAPRKPNTSKRKRQTTP